MPWNGDDARSLERAAHALERIANCLERAEYAATQEGKRLRVIIREPVGVGGE